jgi:ribosomal protein S27AE
MSELFWEMRQTRRINEAAGAASATGQHAVITDHKVGNLADRVDQLTLVCKAMWALIQDCTDLTEEDLLKKVQEMDVHDGVVDGKVSRPVQGCPKCKRPMSAEHRKCLYCGFVKPIETAFDMVK